MLSTPKLIIEEEVNFKVIRGFKVFDLEEILLEEPLCNAELSRFPDGECRICHLLILAYSFLLLF